MGVSMSWGFLVVLTGNYPKKQMEKKKIWCQTMINPGKKHLNAQVPYFPMGKFHLGDSTFLYSLCQHFRRAYQCHCLQDISNTVSDKSLHIFCPHPILFFFTLSLNHIVTQLTSALTIMVQLFWSKPYYPVFIFSDCFLASFFPPVPWCSPRVYSWLLSQ